MSDSLNDYANELEADLTRVTAERNEALELLRECRRWVEYSEDRARHDDDGANGGLRIIAAIEALHKLDALLAKVQPSQSGG